MLGEDHDKTRKYLPRHVCHAEAFCLPVYPAVLLRKLLNLRNRTGEERRRQTLCDKRDNNFIWNNFSPNFTFL